MQGRQHQLLRAGTAVVGADRVSGERAFFCFSAASAPPDPLTCCVCAAGIEHHQRQHWRDQADRMCAQPARIARWLPNALILFLVLDLCSGRCPAGFFGAFGTDCAACENGKYSDTWGSASTSCLLCPSAAGADSLPSRAKKTDCVCRAGFAGQPGGVCSACQPGRFSSAVNTPACQLCPVRPAPNFMSADASRGFHRCSPTRTAPRRPLCAAAIQVGLVAPLCQQFTTPTRALSLARSLSLLVRAQATSTRPRCWLVALRVPRAPTRRQAAPLGAPAALRSRRRPAAAWPSPSRPAW